MGGHWEHFHHSADIGIRGFGQTAEESFRQAALALTGVIVDPGTVPLHRDIQITCANSGDIELLLFDWLNALLLEMSRSKVLFGDYVVSIQKDRLESTAFGASMSDIPGEFTVEIKGATFTELKVARISQSQWLAQCVVDV